MKYKVTIPLTHEMPGMIMTVEDKLIESKEEEALWYFNRSRDHDGVPPVKRLPRGTRFEAIEEETQFNTWQGDSNGSVGCD
jgi:hypothetical protein